MRHLSSLLKSGFSPTCVDFDRFFVYLLRNGRFQAIIHLFTQLAPAEINADDARTRTVFVRALLGEKRYDEAAKFLSTHAKILDRNRLFDHAIQGICTFCRDPELGFSLLKDFSRTHHFSPSSPTLCALLASFIETKQPDRVSFDAVKLMFDSELKFPFDNYVCSYVVSRLMRTGKPELAIRFHGIAVELGRIKPYSAAYSSVLSAYSELRNVDEVPHLVTWFENNNDSAMEMALYSSWLHEDCLREGGFIWEAFKTFRRKRGLKIDFDTIGCSVLIDELSKWGFVEKAFGILYKMKKCGHEPNLLTYTAMIWGFCRKGKLVEAETVFGMLKSAGFEVDEFAYAIMIRGACNEGDIDLVLDLLDEIEKRGMIPGIVTYEAVVDVLSDVDAKNMAVCNALMKIMLMAGMYEDCLSIYKAVRRMGSSPNSGMFRTLVEGYCKTGRTDELLEIFDDIRMMASSPESSADFLNSVMSSLCETGFADVAVDFVAECIEFFESCRRREVCSNAVSHLCKKGFPEAAYEVLLLTMEQRNGRLASSYYCILKSLLSARKTAMARLISTPFVKLRGLSDVRARKIIAHLLCLRDVSAAIRFLSRDEEEELKVVLPATLFRTLIKERRYSDVYELTMAAAAEGRLPRMDVFDYSIMIDGLCKTGHIVRALHLCRTAEENGIALNAVTYNSVINGLCREGCLVEAFRLFRSMAVEPTEVTYGTLIDSLVRRGMLPDARALFDEMFLWGVAPNTRIYNSMMIGYCRGNRPEEVGKLFEDLEAREMAPDEFTAAALMEWRCSEGDVEGALELFLKFSGEGLPPDFAGVMVLIRGLCGKGRMEEARNVVRWMVEEKRGMVGSDSAACLVSGLCEAGRVVEAVGVLEGVFSGNRSRRRGGGVHF